VENQSSGGAGHESLSGALVREHREIDDAIESCAGAASPGADERAGLKRAVDELRHHIYAEEELLFPPLRQAGMVGPILVMLHEHGEMWPLLDTLDDELADGADGALLRTTCGQLLAVLQRHNPKEEQILYPEADRTLDGDASRDIHEFLDAGQMPADWTCHFLRVQHGRG
jgi:iron-sulfur cluster repair protein YtfE (RIC family)